MPVRLDYQSKPPDRPRASLGALAMLATIVLLVNFDPAAARVGRRSCGIAVA